MAQLTTAQRSKIRRLSQPRELAPDEEGGELNIVPFLDIVMNILIFVLATVAVVFTATITTQPPSSKSSGVRQTKPEVSLSLTILIVNDGFALKTSVGNIAPGCERPGPGIAIPRKGAQYDYEALNACAQKLKGSNPEFADETQVFLGGNADVDYQTIVSTVDAVRTTKQGETLFDDVNFRVNK